MSDSLAAEFEPVSPEQWAAQIQEKRGSDAPLLNELEEGVTTRWLYTPADALGADPGGLPGTAPFVRGARVGGKWAIRQEYGTANLNDALEQITDDLADGGDEVLLRVAADGAGGLPIAKIDDLELVLHGVDLDHVPVALQAGTAASATARLLCELWRRHATEAATVAGSLGLDPVSTAARTGASADALERAIGDAVKLLGEVHTEFPQARVLAIDTAPYVDAGAGPVEELAVAIATAIAYLRAAEAAGISPEDVAATLEFRVSVGTDQFTEIAKLRALRRLIATVLEYSGVAAEQRYAPTYARTSRRMVSSVDPWVNILRNTIANFAAAVGGADGITVLPFDEPEGESFGEPGPAARRLARTTQLVTMEESSLGRVSDPAGGSWYVESLTDELAQKAWKRVQEIERDGGIGALIASGKLTEQLAQATAERQAKLAHRKLNKTGVNEFPLLGDDGVSHEAVDDGPSVWDTAKATETALKFARDGAQFEHLRLRAKAMATAGHEPQILLSCTGSLASHVAIAQWGKNFFEAGGIATIASGPQPDDAHQAALLSEHELDAVAVCPGRGTEPEQIASLIAALRGAGAKLIYLAGADDEKAKAQGADLGVRQGVDMVAVLGNLLDHLETSSGTAAADTGRDA
jgi:methylmalonyl-CoA mutase